MGDDMDPLARYDPVKAKALIQNADPTGSKTQGLTYVYDPTNPLNAPTARFLPSQWHATLGAHVAPPAASRTPFLSSPPRGACFPSRDRREADEHFPTALFASTMGAVGSCCY